MASILIIGPHPDDQEIGMGGTIALLASQGHQVTILDVTDGCPTPVGDRETRLGEAAAATRELSGGSTLIRRILLDLPNREVTHSIESRHKVAGVIRAVQADVLFMPHPDDAHPDHIAVTRICEDARFDAKLTNAQMPTPPGFDRIGAPKYASRVIYYYCSHLKSVPNPSFIVDTSDFTARKRRAIECYRSQFELNPLNAGFPERMSAQDAYFGSRIGRAAGEPFFVKEPLGLSSITGVI